MVKAYEGSDSVELTCNLCEGRFKAKEIAIFEQANIDSSDRVQICKGCLKATHRILKRYTGWRALFFQSKSTEKWNEKQVHKRNCPVCGGLLQDGKCPNEKLLSQRHSDAWDLR